MGAAKFGSTQRGDEPDEVRDDLDAFLDEMSGDPSFTSAYDDAIDRTRLIKALTGCRKAERVSQATLASLMGTTQSAVSELEGGLTDPRLSTLQRYARSLGFFLTVELSTDDCQSRFTDGVTQTFNVLVPFERGLPYGQGDIANAVPINSFNGTWGQMAAPACIVSASEGYFTAAAQ